MENKTTINETEFKHELVAFLKTVTQGNFSNKYDELKTIVLSYKNKIPDKSRVIRLMADVDKEMDLDDWQEEVIWDISVRLDGQCTPKKVINW